MTRRAIAHNYSAPGAYHITLHVADGLGQPFGTVVGNLNAPDGSADAPRVALTPVVLIPDNGFPDRYHPSAERQTHCAEGRLLLITPWQYHYRRASENITVAVCKTMNCVAQSLCRTKDNWWQQPQDSNGFPVGILQNQKQYNQYAI